MENIYWLKSHLQQFDSTITVGGSFEADWTPDALQDEFKPCELFSKLGSHFEVGFEKNKEIKFFFTAQNDRNLQNQIFTVSKLKGQVILFSEKKIYLFVELGQVKKKMSMFSVPFGCLVEV